MSGGHEIDPREDGGKTQNEHAKDSKGNIDCCPETVRGVKGPTGIYRSAPREKGKENDDRTGNIKPPREKVYPRDAWRI